MLFYTITTVDFISSVLWGRWVLIFFSNTNWVLVDTTIGYGDGQKRFGWNLISWSTGWPVV